MGQFEEAVSAYRGAATIFRETGTGRRRKPSWKIWNRLEPPKPQKTKDNFKLAGRVFVIHDPNLAIRPVTMTRIDSPAASSHRVDWFGWSVSPWSHGVSGGLPESCQGACSSQSPDLTNTRHHLTLLANRLRRWQPGHGAFRHRPACVRYGNSSPWSAVGDKKDDQGRGENRGGRAVLVQSEFPPIGNPDPLRADERPQRAHEPEAPTAGQGNDLRRERAGPSSPSRCASSPASVVLPASNGPLAQQITCAPCTRDRTWTPECAPAYGHIAGMRAAP